MVFGLEQIGKFFDAIYNTFISWNLVATVIISFIVFVVVNVLLVLLYVRVIKTIPTIVNKIKEIVSKIDNWLS